MGCWFRDVVFMVSVLCVDECCIFSQMCIVFGVCTGG